MSTQLNLMLITGSKNSNLDYCFELILNIKTEDLTKTFLICVTSTAHNNTNGFKNLLALVTVTDMFFKEVTIFM